MKSATPKVLHSIGGRSLLGHVMHTAAGLDPQRIAVVVRHERDQVAAHAAALDPAAVIADQDEIPGTGRAVECGLAALDEATTAELQGPVVILAGDVPLLDAGTLAALLEAHHAQGNAVTVLTTNLQDPTGYGRVVRDRSGQVDRIVEQRDANAEEAAITEINSSVYVMDAGVLRSALGSLDRDNAQGEVYLTDVIAHARRGGLAVRALATEDDVLVEGVNDRVQLAALGAEMNRRTVTAWMRAGVTVVDPATTWIDAEVELDQDVTLLPGTQLHGSTRIGSGTLVGPDSTLTDVVIGREARVERTHGSGAQIGDGATVGPFTFLRPGTWLGEGGKLGAYVEVKNAEIGAGSKVPHLSYIGDATIGEETNIGAASVTVNYDGVKKHRTVVGSHARTGADNMFVAPVEVGDGAYTGAGTVVRRDVPPGALAVSGGPQRIFEGWTVSRRPGTPAAEAAQAAESAQAESARSAETEPPAETAQPADDPSGAEQGREPDRTDPDA